MSPQGLKKKSMQGAAWTSMQAVITQLLTFLTFLILARLLVKEEFGLVASAMAIIQILILFVNQGFTASIVQRKDLSQEYNDTAFWTNLMIAVALAGGLSLLAGPLTDALLDPETTKTDRIEQMPWLLRALSLRLLIEPFAAVPGALLQRDMLFRVLAIRSVTGVLVGGIAGIVMAFLGAGAWSLVGLQIAGQLVGAIILWTSTSYRPTFHFSRRHLRELMSFGTPVLGSNLFSFAALRSSHLVAAPVLGAAAVAMMEVAMRLVNSTQMLVLKSTVAPVSFAALSRLQHDLRRAGLAYTKGTKLSCAVAWPVFLGISSLAEPTIAVLFGEQYREASGVLVVLCFAACFSVLAGLTSPALKGLGKPGWDFIASVISGVGSLAGYIVAAPHGIMAIAYVHLIRAVSMSLLRLVMVVRLTTLTPSTFVGAMASPVLPSLVLLASVTLTRIWLGGRLSDAGILAVCIPLGMAVYPAAVRLLAPKLYFELKDTFSQVAPGPVARLLRLAPKAPDARA